MNSEGTLNIQAELDKTTAHNAELKEALAMREYENGKLREQLRQAVNPIKRDTYAAAVKMYGKTSQLVMTMEEMSELTKELSKNMRGQDNVSAISEEMADVEIMLEQLKVIFSNRAEVDRYRADKITRLAVSITGGVAEKLHTKEQTL